MWAQVGAPPPPLPVCNSCFFSAHVSLSLSQCPLWNPSVVLPCETASFDLIGGMDCPLVLHQWSGYVIFISFSIGYFKLNWIASEGKKNQSKPFTCFNDALHVFKPFSIAQSELHSSSVNDSGGVFESEMLPTCLIFLVCFLCFTGLWTVSGKWANLAAAQLILSRPASPLALHVSIYCPSINALATTTWYHPLIFSKRMLADTIRAVDVRTRRSIKERHASAALNGGDSMNSGLGLQHCSKFCGDFTPSSKCVVAVGCVSNS